MSRTPVHLLVATLMVASVVSCLRLADTPGEFPCASSSDCEPGEVCGPQRYCIPDPNPCPGGICRCQAPFGTQCGLSCVDILSDPNHCGGCNVLCGSIGGVCIDGACNCFGEVCGDVCIDVTTDSRHCGGCDRQCGPGNPCVSGACGGSTGGAGGSGGAGGTGGSGGGGTGGTTSANCTPVVPTDPFVTCSTIGVGTVECETCAYSRCCDEIEVCFRSTVCAGVNDCLDAHCSGLGDQPAELDACMRSSCGDCLDGVPTLQRVVTCLRTECSSECKL